MKDDISIILQKNIKFQRIPYIQESIASIFNNDVTVIEERIDINPFYNSNRVQYNAANIIDSQEIRQDKKYLIIAIHDLFIPIFTFVFGLAKLNGNVAVISTHRLNNRYYGLPENEDLLTERIIKEAVHEIGHLFGLRHCIQYNCVMVNSTSAEEIDVKNTDFCPSCLNILQNNSPVS